MYNLVALAVSNHLASFRIYIVQCISNLISTQTNTQYYLFIKRLYNLVAPAVPNT